MSRSRVHTTPWSRAALKAIGIGDLEIGAIAMNLPDDTHLHISGRGPRGPWTVRAFIDGREVTEFDRHSPGSPDLGHAVEYVLAQIRGAVAGGR